MARKYRFKDRAAAEAECVRLEQELTLHRIALDALLRDEFVWTRRFDVGCGSWFEMGIARASAAHGGVVMVRESYPTNGKPTQNAHWADGWVRAMSGHCYAVDRDEEAQAYRDCFYALRELYNRAVQAA